MARMLTHQEKQQMALSLFRRAAEEAQDGSYYVYAPEPGGEKTHRAVTESSYKLLQDALIFIRTWGL
jgi:hypothetical protein